jgi:hypothetical protein
MMSKGNAMNGMNGASMNGASMNGMGDMFTYPQGTTPEEFLAQQIQSGAMPSPAERMDESFMYDGGAPAPQVGRMSWESGPAPWEQTALPNHMPGPIFPSAAPAEIAQINAAGTGDAKAVQAAQAAKIAADNAIRAARAGATQVAVTNAATAQAAASVAAQSAQGGQGQRAAAVAANEATKAVAAANVAANGVKKGGLNDWMELSGLGSVGLLDQRVLGIQVKHLAIAGAVVAGAVWGLPWLKKKFK